ncbi:hypothetical protein NQ318_023105 [Aromia moschata]|uniref:EGF-like domain-containing protein n=1 Tax=Aromia moschata TaxID=1265417 RepID=A0AAV8XGH0_9CUCU|nr:hypothetical protein NQ318_023105 [Aromia moschata]
MSEWAVHPGELALRLHLDCDDGSDEPDECKQNQNCRPEQFQCALTKKCIPKGWKCDEEADCGVSPDLGPDTSDEDPQACPKGVRFCDGRLDCPGNSDEWNFCDNGTSACDKLKCTYGCKPTPQGPQCYCPTGKRPEDNRCVDADECELDDSCAQMCTNTVGSYECSCVSGYQLNGTDCIAINIPASEPPSLIFSTQSEIRRVTLDGKSFPGNSTLHLLNSNALEFIHRNHTVCYVHHNVTRATLVCANINDLNQRWNLPVRSPLLEVDSIHQIALDWITDNWYFLDDQREIILVCTHYLEWCNILVDYRLSKPRGLALDPTSGYLFFTKWGHSHPMLERCKMDGSERKAIVDIIIVYPYGVTVDYPKRHVYWVDTYLDYVERVDYDGDNRRTRKLYVSSWYNNSILELDKFDHDVNTIVMNISRPFNVHVFHKQRQPDVAHPCKASKDCAHLCIPLWHKDIAIKRCLCASGYVVQANKCVVKTPSRFLLISKSRPFSIKGIDLETGNDTMVPIMKIVIRLTVPVLLKDVDCDGLAFDWIARNLYWTNLERGSINVVRLSNASLSRTLLQSSNFNPTSITVDPFRGAMYWADWSSMSPDKGHIDVADMDGKNRRIFLNANVHWPSGFGHRPRGKTAILGLALGPHKQLYFVELMQGTIKVFRNETGLKKVYEGKFALVRRQTVRRGVATSYEENGAVCGCSDGFQLVNDTCAKQKNYTSPSVCPADSFQCRRGRHCIPNSYVCDGIDNCEDGSDESSDVEGPCQNVSCGEQQLKCDNTTCISKHWVCDGDKDCQDGTDEDYAMCLNVCSGTQFKCKNSRRCIPMVWRCDRVSDCGPGDDSDEIDCKVSTCDINEFTCKDGQCIAAGFYCDSILDCDDGDSLQTVKQMFVESHALRRQKRLSDGSDERNCAPKIDCEPDEFACANNECIPKIFVCDSDLDCLDSSDEMKCDNIKNGTESKTHALSCEPPHKLCDNKTKCISAAQLCDNRQDCEDGTDEGGQKCSEGASGHADSELHGPALTCEYPSRLCDNATKCVAVERLCDERDDCADGSDEGLRCGDMLCEHSFVCSHDCHNAPEGLICTCPPHLHLQADRTHCLETHPCMAWGVCSQMCVPRGSRYKCTCLDGYVMQEDGFTCKSVDKGRPLVIFSNRYELRSVDLHTSSLKSFIFEFEEHRSSRLLPHKRYGHVEIICYGLKSIRHGGGGTLGNIEIVVQTGLSTAEGLAVDWIGENLYWVESNLDQIEVAKLNGSYRRTLVAGDMESPRAIAVDPRDGYLFWTDWESERPRIERCSLAGLDRKAVVKVANGGWPNGLTLDYTMRRMYWIDARFDSIHTTDYNGDDHHEVMRNHEMLSHPFAITLFENYVYWTDWRTNSVVRANKWTGGDVRVIQRTLTQPFDIKIMHPSRQPRDVGNPCGENNGGCSHLCLIHLNRTYRCDCPHVMRLSADNRTCEVNERVLLISGTTGIRGVDIQQPYYHTIPTISVINLIQLEYLARNSTIYWADANEVKRIGLTHGPSETLIDTGLQGPTGQEPPTALAVDWLSNLLFVSSTSKIIVCNLDGEYTTNVVEGVHVLAMTINPQRGRLFWASLGDDAAAIESSAMDGSARKAILSTSLPTGREVFYSDSDGGGVARLNLSAAVNVTALTVYRGEVYYADQHEPSIRVADKLTGANDSFLRSSIGGVLALRIYDPEEQKGRHPCGRDKGGCAHLCLPTSETTYTCACAIGYETDPRDASRCVGIDEFIFFSVNWELQGVSMDGENDTGVLGPISRVSSAAAIDFVAEKDLIFWADSEHGTVTRIKRDGTERKFVFEQTEIIDTVAVDWLSCLAVDWISGNMYWCDSKRGTIEVSRLDGTKEHVLLSNEMGKPTALAVDPVRGT